MNTQGQIFLRLNTVAQLLEPNPPSPFPAPRLRKEAEAFIVERATDLPSTSTATLIVCLAGSDASQVTLVTEAVHQHFAFRRGEAERKLSRIRQLGWRSLLIGLVFLSVTILLVQIMKRYLPPGNLYSLIEGGLTILAWVALWRPAELLLYDWYPFRRAARLFSRLERAGIQFIADPSVSGRANAAP